MFSLPFSPACLAGACPKEEDIVGNLDHCISFLKWGGPVK